MSKPLSFYQTTFQPTTPKQQAAFLEQLFERDSDIREQFEQFIVNWDDASDSNIPIVSFVDLEELAAEIREELSDLHFDMESVYNHFEEGDRSYVPGHEAAWEGAENMLRKEGFETYTKQAEQFLKKGNLFDATKVLLAMYEGHNNVYAPGSDEEEVFDDYNGNCLDVFKEQMETLFRLYKKKTKSEESVRQILDLLVERVYMCVNSPDETFDEEDGSVHYDLSVFNPLLKILMPTPKMNLYFKKILEEHQLDRHGNPTF